jgi:hypothetical protein
MACPPSAVTQSCSSIYYRICGCTATNSQNWPRNWVLRSFWMLHNGLPRSLWSTIFGLNGNADPKDTSQIGWEGSEFLPRRPFVYPLSQFRIEVRRQARFNTFSRVPVNKLASKLSTPSEPLKSRRCMPQCIPSSGATSKQRRTNLPLGRTSLPSVTSYEIRLSSI